VNLLEWQAERRLADTGVPVPRGEVVRDAEDCARLRLS